MEEKASGFVDGDLLDTCSLMRKAELEALVSQFESARIPTEEDAIVRQPYTADLVMKVLEDLSRLH